MKGGGGCVILNHVDGGEVWEVDEMPVVGGMRGDPLTYKGMENGKGGALN